MQQPILLITPPFTQLNTPYPATAYIKGFLNTKHIASFQLDLGMEVIWQLFSASGLTQIFDTAAKNQQNFDANTQRIFALRANYEQTIDAVILFLQGKHQTLARQLCSAGFLPQASRFAQLDDMDWAFGTMGIQDKAKHYATLYLEDISDFIVATIDPDFGFSRYAERLGRSANSFDELYNRLNTPQSYIDTLAIDIINQKIHQLNPKLVCFSVPFPGNLYSACKMAQHIKSNFTDIEIAMGGGFANTELRSVSDARVFHFFDYIALDDGELPLELIINSLNQQSKTLKRTFILENNTVVYKNNSTKSDYKQSEIGTPDYTDLFLDKYISVIELANPMHSLWSNGRWNKLTLAHGCYWGKCTFCDISLDYIKLYEPIAAKLIVDRIKQLIDSTNETGFHFVDEAAPPALMREIALEIIKRKLVISWWTNIRFEKSFTYDLCQLLKASGCIAVSGGLEVASDRLLALIDKGVTVEQVAQVTQNFQDAGIMVHAYLMYGYPTQTIQETIDSLEMVRQLFLLGTLQSGFWHQFALTAHSPVGLNPEKYHIIAQPNAITFANNDINFIDKTQIDHNIFSYGLKKSLFNYMHGIGSDLPLQNWFDFKIPKTKINPNYIENAIASEPYAIQKPTTKIIWLHALPKTEIFNINKKGNTKAYLKFTIYNKINNIEILFDTANGAWLAQLLSKISINQTKTYTFQEIKTDFEIYGLSNFELFWYSEPIGELKNYGLVCV
ncbi:MAG: radical SAM protein [Bacteroidetes bacterium]|nr:MAG: radical SAM protein [Bacteroidota bacterium]